MQMPVFSGRQANPVETRGTRRMIESHGVSIVGPHERTAVQATA
jgi:hypothetical protein